MARDRRRAGQAATATEQEQRGRDASNPNWEFQQMIDDYKEDLDMTETEMSSVDDVLDLINRETACAVHNVHLR